MKICILGSGYVGLVSGACFSDLGNTVTCVDINKIIVEKLNKGIIPIYEPGLQELVERNLKKKRLLFSTNISSSIKRSDIIFICVGTPTKNNKADLKYVFHHLYLFFDFLDNEIFSLIVCIYLLQHYLKEHL